MFPTATSQSTGWLPTLPRLQVLPLEELLVHEWYDDQRARPLAARILTSGVFRNPPIVIPTSDDTSRFVVLDGANRLAALRLLGCRHLIAQVVSADDPGLRLRTWNHLLLDSAPESLLTSLRSIPDLDIASSLDPDVAMPSRREVGIAFLQTADGGTYGLSAPAADLPGRIAVLNAIVDSYKSNAALDRTIFSDISQVRSLYANLSALFIFPKFDLGDVVHLASIGCLLPPGITRITVSPRVLYLNFPLSQLMGDASLQAKQNLLSEVIRERFARNKVVYYSEETFIFDE